MSKYVITAPTQTDSTIDELENRARNYFRYDKITSSYFLMVLVILLGLVFVLTILSNWGVSLPSNWGIPLATLDLGVPLVVVLLAARKRAEYYLNTDEWAKFYTHSILANLRYLGTESRGMKKTYKRKTLKDTKDFLSCIEEKWTVGNFKPAEDFVGTAIDDLKKNIRYRVIPAIKGEDKDLLNKVTGLMSEFLIYSNNLSVGYIQIVNRMMSELPNRESLGKTRFSRIMIYTRTNQMVKHSLVLVALGVSSLLLTYIAFTLGVRIEYCWMGGITLFVGSAGIYFSRQPKGKK